MVAAIERLRWALRKVTGWWGNVLATDHYESPRNDLASDFHDFCALNSLDRTDIKSAEYFLKELKAEQMMKDIEKDF